MSKRLTNLVKYSLSAILITSSYGVLSESLESQSKISFIQSGHSDGTHNGEFSSTDIYEIIVKTKSGSAMGAFGVNTFTPISESKISWTHNPDDIELSSNLYGYPYVVKSISEKTTVSNEDYKSFITAKNYLNKNQK